MKLTYTLFLIAVFFKSDLFAQVEFVMDKTSPTQAFVNSNEGTNVEDAALLKLKSKLKTVINNSERLTENQWSSLLSFCTHIGEGQFIYQSGMIEVLNSVDDLNLVKEDIKNIYLKWVRKEGKAEVYKMRRLKEYNLFYK